MMGRGEKRKERITGNFNIAHSRETTDNIDLKY